MKEQTKNLLISLVMFIGLISVIIGTTIYAMKAERQHPPKESKSF